MFLRSRLINEAELNMNVYILIIATVYVVQADIFVRSYNSVLDQVFLEKQTMNDLACSRLCLGMSECNAFNFTSTEQRCMLARNITEVANIDEKVYIRKPFEQPLVCAIGTKYENSCYVFGTQAMYWGTAKSACASMGYRLATITSATENQFVSDLVKGAYGGTDTWVWIGGTYTNAIQWITGENAVYSSWKSGHPTTSGTPLCVEIVAGNSYAQAQWATGDCNHGHLYLCEKELA